MDKDKIPKDANLAQVAYSREPFDMDEFKRSCLRLDAYERKMERQRKEQRRIGRCEWKHSKFNAIRIKIDALLTRISEW